MKEILVFADWIGLPSLQLMGVLRTQVSKGKEIFSFEHEPAWLKSGFTQLLDPDLKHFVGPQYLPDSKSNFGMFLDSSPDRWGRMLMKRKEAITAREENRQPNHLHESDYLLGVYDELRMGAIRFRMKVDGQFLDHGKNLTTPPITSMRELEQASLRIEDDNFFADAEAKKWLNILMAPGSSLGGARPKASVRDVDNSLWLAKFPSKNDNKDSGAWEYITYQMAIDLDIRMAPSRAAIFSRSHHSFLTKRFDRSDDQERIHFASAMTLLGYKDGHDHLDGGSYLEIVELIEQYGADPIADIRELWKRIVFSVAVSNTDDHLRNHGFLLMKDGWKLSPAYDINPNEDGQGLSLNISEDDNSLSFDLCLDVCSYFRWNKKEAVDWINKTKQTIKTWKSRAQKMSISRTQIEMMKTAFLH